MLPASGRGVAKSGRQPTLQETAAQRQFLQDFQLTARLATYPAGTARSLHQ
jgi:hypothetical protein